MSFSSHDDKVRLSVDDSYNRSVPRVNFVHRQEKILTPMCHLKTNLFISLPSHTSAKLHRNLMWWTRLSARAPVCRLKWKMCYLTVRSAVTSLISCSRSLWKNSSLPILHMRSGLICTSTESSTSLLNGLIDTLQKIHYSLLLQTALDQSGTKLLGKWVCQVCVGPNWCGCCSGFCEHTSLTGRIHISLPHYVTICYF